MSSTANNTKLSSALIERLDELFTRSESDPRPVVFMTCGIAGAGKSTLSKLVINTWPKFTRLSIDAWVYSHHGLYGVDYPKDRYSGYQDDAHDALKTELATLLKEKHDVVLDFAFAFRDMRTIWQKIVEENGGRWVLVYLRQDEDELRRRVRARNALANKDGDSAFDLTDETLSRWLKGFEVPIGEGEIKLAWVDSDTIGIK